MIVASLFGTPAGLEVHRNAIGTETPLKIEDRWLDNLPDDIHLNNNDGVFRIHRRVESGHLLTWVGLYRAAHEIGASRPGGYYGAGLWLIDTTVPSRTIVDVLLNLANQIRDLALNNGKFVRKIAEIRSAIVPPPQVATLLTGRTEIASGISVHGVGRAFIADPNNIVAILDWAQRGYSSAYFNELTIGSADQFSAKQAQFVKGMDQFASMTTASDFAYGHMDSSRHKDINDLQHALADRNQQIAKLTETANALQATTQQLTQDLGSLEHQLQLTKSSLSEERNRSQKLKEHQATFQRYPEPIRQVTRRPEPSFIRSNLFSVLLSLGVILLTLGAVGVYAVSNAKAVADLLTHGEYTGKQKELVEVNNQLASTKDALTVAVKERDEARAQLSNHTNKPEAASTRVTPDASSVSPVDPDDSNCKTNFVRVNYAIVVPIGSKEKKLPLRPSIYEAITKQCSFKELEPSCTKTLNNLKKAFTTDIDKYNGDTWVVDTCSNTTISVDKTSQVQVKLAPFAPIK